MKKLIESKNNSLGEKQRGMEEKCTRERDGEIYCILRCGTEPLNALAGFGNFALV